MCECENMRISECVNTRIGKYANMRICEYANKNYKLKLPDNLRGLDVWENYQISRTGKGYWKQVFIQFKKNRRGVSPYDSTFNISQLEFPLYKSFMGNIQIKNEHLSKIYPFQNSANFNFMTLLQVCFVNY